MRISINAGHTKKGPGGGAAYKGFNEADITRAVAAALVSKLRQDGHKVFSSTVNSATSQNAYLREVCRLANDSGAELFISLHCNASAKHTGFGVECWTWRGNKVPAAVKICKNLEALDFRNRGVKDGSGFYVVKHTKATAVLVELFFLDNEKDRALYTKHGADKIAAAIATSL
jgi:N-acetylmuramoyl-L-alanine amidase